MWKFLIEWFHLFKYLFACLDDDFASDADIYMACLILQKQIEHIDGKKENIVIPSIKMKKIREDAEKERAGMFII